jgi:hypothetical protein
MRLQTEFSVAKKAEVQSDKAMVTMEIELERYPMNISVWDNERIGRCADAAIEAFQNEWKK